MKKGVALVIVWGILLMITTLALAAIYLMGNEARVSEHKVRRTIAYYLAQAALVYAFDNLRNNSNWGGDPNFQLSSGEDLNFSANITVGNTITNTNTILDGTKEVKIQVDY